MVISDIRDGKTFLRLCRKNGCCPEVSYDEKTQSIVITDDYSGIVKIPVDSLEDLVTSLGMLSNQLEE